MKPSELVAEAHDEMAAGWVAGQYVTIDGEVCGIGALQRVAMRHMAFAEAGVAQQALEAKAHELFQATSVQDINDRRDTHGTRKQDMLNMYWKVHLDLDEHGL